MRSSGISVWERAKGQQSSSHSYGNNFVSGRSAGLGSEGSHATHIVVQEHVLRLEVAVDEAQQVQILQRQQHLSGVKARCFLLKQSGGESTPSANNHRKDTTGILSNEFFSVKVRLFLRSDGDAFGACEGIIMLEAADSDALSACDGDML